VTAGNERDEIVFHLMPGSLPYAHDCCVQVDFSVTLPPSCSSALAVTAYASIKTGTSPYLPELRNVHQPAFHLPREPQCRRFQSDDLQSSFAPNLGLALLQQLGQRSTFSSLMKIEQCLRNDCSPMTFTNPMRHMICTLPSRAIPRRMAP
jgi:hypothetical protein